MKVLGQIKPCFSFWLKIKFRKIATNKYVDLRKIENSVRSKSCPEDILKDKGKKVNFRKSSKNFKIVHGHHRTYKGKRRVIFDNDRKLLIRCLNCRQSKPFKCFNIAIPYPFMFTRKFREDLFPKKVLIYQEKMTPRSIYFLENYD